MKRISFPPRFHSKSEMKSEMIQTKTGVPWLHACSKKCYAPSPLPFAIAATAAVTASTTAPSPHHHLPIMETTHVPGKHSTSKLCPSPNAMLLIMTDSESRFGGLLAWCWRVQQSSFISFCHIPVP